MDSGRSWKGHAREHVGEQLSHTGEEANITGTWGCRAGLSDLRALGFDCGQVPAEAGLQASLNPPGSNSWRARKAWIEIGRHYPACPAGGPQ